MEKINEALKSAPMGTMLRNHLHVQSGVRSRSSRAIRRTRTSRRHQCGQTTRNEGRKTHLSQLISTFLRPSRRWVVRSRTRVPAVAYIKWKVVRKIGLRRSVDVSTRGTLERRRNAVRAY